MARIYPPHELSPREKQLKAIADRVESLVERTAAIRVIPRDETIRKGLSHPNGDIKFPESGSVEWPLDNFTQRRLRDGTVMVAPGQNLDEKIKALIPHVGPYDEYMGSVVATPRRTADERTQQEHTHQEHMARQASIAAKEDADARARRGQPPKS